MGPKFIGLHLFVEPRVLASGPSNQFLFFEPESDFFVGIFNSVTSVNDVSARCFKNKKVLPADFDGKISSNGSRSRSRRVGSSNQGSSSLNDIFSFPHHSNNGSRSKVLIKIRIKIIKYFTESLVERLFFQIKVVLFSVSNSDLFKFHSNQFESLLFESSDDFSNLGKE